MKTGLNKSPKLQVCELNVLQALLHCHHQDLQLCHYRL